MVSAEDARSLDVALKPLPSIFGDLAHTVVQQAGQIAAVLALHYPSDDHNEPGWEPYCVGCWEAGGMDGAPTYPCPTARALGVTE